MIKRFLGSKLTVLFLSMAIIGFLIGYDYALITSKQDNAEAVKGTNSIEKTEFIQDEATADEVTNIIEEVPVQEGIDSTEEISEIQEDPDTTEDPAEFREDADMAGETSENFYD